MEKSSFFNSINGDRKYKAEDFAAYFGSFISNGIFPNPADNLRVVSNDNMTVTLKPGKAWINGYFYVNDDDLILSIDVANGVLDRIDRVVIRLDYVNREIRAVVKKGQFSSNPVAPELQRDADAYELALADVRVNAGTTSISQDNITDLRDNKELCGWVDSLIAGDVSALAAQLDKHKADYATQDTLGHIKLSDIPSTADDIGAFDQSNYGNIVSSTEDLTLDLSHANTVLVYGTTSARIITVPNNSSVPFPIGTQITVIRNSTGTVTFVPASGVTLNSKDNKRSIDGRYASATLIKTDTNKWVLIGALV